MQLFKVVINPDRSSAVERHFNDFYVVAKDVVTATRRAVARWKEGNEAEGAKGVAHSVEARHVTGDGYLVLP